MDRERNKFLMKLVLLKEMGADPVRRDFLGKGKDHFRAKGLLRGECQRWRRGSYWGRKDGYRLLFLS